MKTILTWPTVSPACSGVLPSDRDRQWCPTFRQRQTGAGCGVVVSDSSQLLTACLTALTLNNMQRCAQSRATLHTSDGTQNYVFRRGNVSGLGPCHSLTCSRNLSLNAMEYSRNISNIKYNKMECNIKATGALHRI